MNLYQFEQLKAAYTLEINKLNQRVLDLEAEVARLKELLRLQQAGLFGKKSEVSSSLNPPIPSVVEPTEPQLATVKSHTRIVPPRGKRQLNTEQLPRYRVTHELSDAQKICECCGNALQPAGQEKSEQLEIIPVQYCVVEHVRLKYSCRSCQSIVSAPKPLAPLPKALAGASLLTDVVLDKYQYHLPLYRQSKIMQSHGMAISDKTLANWVMAAGEVLLPIYEALWVILKSRYLQVDETPVKVLETNKKGYVWAYFAPNVGKGLVAFEFSLTREARVANERLKDFKGLLQTDAYKGYDALRQRPDIIGFGCLSHARRKFSEVIKISGDQQGIAAQVIDRLKPLYALEARLREKQASHRTRKHLRQRIARPILKELHTWLSSIQSQVLPKSKLGQAIAYTLKQWPYLIAYLRHGMAEIDTNYVENKIRDIALGRKNWLFIGNHNCGKIHALWYSLIISAVINEINPRVYIHYLLTQVHQLRRGLVDPISLLPDRINMEKLEQFALAQVDFGRQMLAAFDSS
jgi:transposase